MDSASLYRLGLCFALAVFLLVLLELFLRFASKRPSLRQNEVEKNPASSLLHAGDVVATFLVAATVAGNLDTRTLGEDLRTGAAQGVAALVLLLGASRAQVRVFLTSRGQLQGELERGNVAAGLAAAAHSIATAILAGAAVGAETVRDAGVALVFFVLGQVALMALVAAFRALTLYDDAQEIHGENMAAAVSYAGVTLAVALLVGRASEGTFTTWVESLAAFAQIVAYAPLLYLVRQLVVGSVLLGARPALRGGPLDRAVGERNVGIAALEAATYLGTALIVNRLP